MREIALLDRNPRPSERPLTIYVPKGYEIGDVVIVGVCHCCGAKFGRGEEQDWQRHVGACYRLHESDLRARAPSERNRGGPWDDNTWDPEVEQHMLKVGRQMVREGRMEVKPNERAGFS